MAYDHTTDLPAGAVAYINEQKSDFAESVSALRDKDDWKASVCDTIATMVIAQVRPNNEIDMGEYRKELVTALKEHFADGSLEDALTDSTFFLRVVES